ncbi:PREDICTED: fasciclin-like arabinogalactan protein 2 [Tarenaya hassleriana]|uniref:fasciclin-like arabinogalactan protein 2 n=1 Tax=Tarenaya hassleriana TaxID=28532 RepID=UPI00053C2113|nr:PREDICTED: fasciclin-like arabinogalactan protein 2 [Tarenaya hassleriana]XP_010557721.1 PREDICTED: fasciclin-like arabinogalactan protein 2 [Tarenaya hassleriana]
MAPFRLSATVSAFSLLFCLLLSSSNAHNITRILAKDPSFSTFNHYLSATHLADDINRRQTITVLAVDNAGMSSILSKGYSLYTIRNILSLHVLVDYFGAKKLHQITDGTTSTSTMFQATGSATGTSGYVNITDLKGGKVAFGVQDDDSKLTAHYIKSVFEKAYNISVLQISQVLTSPEAEAPTPSPGDLNLTSILDKQGCKAFADMMTSTGADKTFQDTIDGGLTVFCPTDGAVSKFMPKFKSLSAANKTALVLYHGIPVYQSLQMLRSGNGAVNTLATEGDNKYDFTVQNDGEDVTLETDVVTAQVTGTLKDQEPLIVYKIDKVLMPREIFKATVKEAPSPKPSKHKKKSTADDELADGPGADAPADDSEDQVADDKNGAAPEMMTLTAGRSFLTAIVGFCLGVAYFM